MLAMPSQFQPIKFFSTLHTNDSTSKKRLGSYNSDLSIELLKKHYKAYVCILSRVNSSSYESTILQNDLEELQKNLQKSYASLNEEPVTIYKAVCLVKENFMYLPNQIMDLKISHAVSTLELSLHHLTGQYILQSASTVSNHPLQIEGILAAWDHFINTIDTTYSGNYAEEMQKRRTKYALCLKEQVQCELSSNNLPCRRF